MCMPSFLIPLQECLLLKVIPYHSIVCVCSSLSSVGSCFIGLHFGHVLVHRKVWLPFLISNWICTVEQNKRFLTCWPHRNFFGSFCEVYSRNQTQCQSSPGALELYAVMCDLWFAVCIGALFQNLALVLSCSWTLSCGTDATHIRCVPFCMFYPQLSTDQYQIKLWVGLARWTVCAIFRCSLWEFCTVLFARFP